MGYKLLARLTTVATTVADGNTENTANWGQKVVDWFNKTNVKATFIILGIGAAVVGGAALVYKNRKKIFK